MSNYITTYVYRNSRMTGAAKFLLVCIGEIVNDEGFGYAKLATLQQRTGMSRRWVQYNLRRLELAGELTVFQKVKDHNYFLVRTPENSVITEPDPEALQAIPRIKQVPGRAVERRSYEEYKPELYEYLGDQTRRAINNRERVRERGRSRRDDTPQEEIASQDTHTPQKKGRGKGR